MKLFHNPKCSKSRIALKFFEENNIEIDVVLYQKVGLTERDAQHIVKNFDDDFSHLLRKSSQHDIKPDLSEKEKIDLLIRFAEHLQRPLLLTDADCIIGRPLENFSTIETLSRYFSTE